MYIIAGLGNPGSRYAATRHNIGFVLLDQLAAELGLTFTPSSKWPALTCKGQLLGESVLLIKPQTFMNLSGEAVIPALDYFKVDPGNLIVIHDDLDLACGQVKLAYKRGPGGHNGLRSINAHLGSTAYNRVRLGIGRPPAGMPVDRYVLSKFSGAEEEGVASALDIGRKAVDLLVDVGMAQAMQVVHSL
ncbi:MAG: aminoacyl-tRNA hydrolase [Thermodesulfobacteriota bacterium]